MTGYEAGYVFGYGFDFGENEKWNRYEGNFNIGVEGDSVILYCLLGDGAVNPLVAYSNSNEWMEPNLTASEYGSTGSALPEELSDVGSIVLPHLDNYQFKDGEKLRANKTTLQTFMMDPNNWGGSDKGLGDLSAGVTHINGFYAALTFLAVALAQGFS